MTGYVVGYISQPNGKYKMHKTGAGKYYGSIGNGIDYYGKPFITAAGTPNDLGVFKQNNRYIWNGVGLQTVYDGVLPGISAGGGWAFRFTSSNGKYSDRLVQQTSFRGYLAAEGFYMENGSWYPTNVVRPDITKIIATNVTWTIYSGDKKIVDVAQYGDKQILVGGGQGNVENLCTVKNGPNESFIAALTLMPVLKQPYDPAKPLTMDSIQHQIEHTLFTFKNNGKELVREKITIQGETEFLDTKMECIDVNKDGYDDLVMSIVPNSTEIVKIYINQKDKTFKKLDLGDTTKFVLSSKDRVHKHMSIIGDFDNDGIQDVIVYPDHVDNNLNLNGAIKFFKGMKAIQ